ncbi:hypothetical protein C8R43DRAFT_964054 [Mycena crocata]|nr:hypothetical protein C8R43DRAFT_964054 [Mycena crocata]
MRPRPGSTAGEQMISPEFHWINLVPEVCSGAQLTQIQSLACAEACTLLRVRPSAFMEHSRTVVFVSLGTEIFLPQNLMLQDIRIHSMSRIISSKVLDLMCHACKDFEASLQVSKMCIERNCNLRRARPLLAARVPGNQLSPFRTTTIPIPPPPNSSLQNAQTRCTAFLQTTPKTDYTIYRVPASGMKIQPFFSWKKAAGRHPTFQVQYLPAAVSSRTMEALHSSANIDYMIYRVPASGPVFSWAAGRHTPLPSAIQRGCGTVIGDAQQHLQRKHHTSTSPIPHTQECHRRCTITISRLFNIGFFGDLFLCLRRVVWRARHVKLETFLDTILTVWIIFGSKTSIFFAAGAIARQDASITIVSKILRRGRPQRVHLQLPSSAPQTRSATSF